MCTLNFRGFLLPRHHILIQPWFPSLVLCGRQLACIACSRSCASFGSLLSAPFKIFCRLFLSSVRLLCSLLPLIGWQGAFLRPIWWAKFVKFRFWKKITYGYNAWHRFFCNQFWHSHFSFSGTIIINMLRKLNWQNLKILHFWVFFWLKRTCP